MRQAMEAELRRIWRQAQNDALRLKAAEKALADGNTPLACRLYVRVALSLPKRQATEYARQQLARLSGEATAQLEQLDKQLETEEAPLSPSEVLQAKSLDTPALAQWSQRVQAAFERYDELEEKYHDLPGVEQQIRAHQRKQRLKPEYAVVLNEPKAKELWDSGQKHEVDQEACCAYWAYREASRLVPAPSALLAEKRLAVMEKDPEILAAAEACRKLQECHGYYDRAQRIESIEPKLARTLYAKITARAPQDTELYQAAQARLAKLGP